MPKKCFPVRGAKGCVRIDPDMEPVAAEHSWHMHKDYPATTIGSGKGAYKLYLHRLVLGAAPGTIVDHANGDHLDARRENLRFADKSQNAANIGKISTNRSGFKGVVKHGKRFRAFIHKNGKTQYLGTFDTAKAAACEYDRAAKRLFGRFSKTNDLKCPR